MADNLKLNLQHCYGIGKLQAELEFKHKGYAIYAPNGVMKTSFAKTMIDLSLGNKPKDLHFPEREPVHEVTLNGEPLKTEEIFVVRSYDEKYASDQVSTLLANSELKSRYEKVHRAIGDARKDLDKALKRISGIGERSKENIEPILQEVFGARYYDALLSIEGEVDEGKLDELSDANYKILFDPKVQQFLADANVAAAVEDFAKKYDEITEKSPILRREFQYHNVSQVQQQLAANNFFEAGHKISLIDENTASASEIDSDQSLSELIEAEKLRVLDNADVKDKFDTFNAKLKNKELQAFRDYITENKHLLSRLEDTSALKRDLWLQYILSAQDEYRALLSEYRTGQAELAKIVAEAEGSRGDWDDVIADFNRRFLYLPFKLLVENKADAILKEQAPSVGFVIRDGDDERNYGSSEKADLLTALSTGESRALYILDIMYEVFVRWKNRSKTLFVFDDISDSFDYKNKFAIIDFLEGVTKDEDNNFLAIVLTHNFDFLRTVSSRQICPPHQCRLAFRSENEVKLSDFQRSDIQNPFHKWQGRLAEPEILIAYIPFLRNVIEYTLGAKDSDGNYNAEYLQLTRMLHFKDETNALTLANYKAVFEKFLPNCDFPEVALDTKIIEHLFAVADATSEIDTGVNLEHKIVLSIAIRMWAERYMVAKIRGDEPEFDISKKQTGEIFQKFKEKFNNQSDEIGLLRRVNLITPANIHINAFMYEPILDMGLGELHALYSEVKAGLV